MITYYDFQFNQNEWFATVIFVVAYSIVLLLPKRFPMLTTTVFLLYGIFLGHFLDHTISVRPFDFYDVNDNSLYEFFDLVTYVMYGPFSYFMPYFFDRYGLKRQHIVPYIVIWSVIALGLEWIGIQLGTYHYQKGWRIGYSFPSYLMINSVLLALYYKLYKNKEV